MPLGISAFVEFNPNAFAISRHNTHSNYERGNGAIKRDHF